MFADVYRNRRVLLTGHTGFKGSWLALWLQSLGAEVTGLALKPDTTPNHWSLLNLGIKEHHVDIRDTEKISKIVVRIEPDIVFHLAAQSLVRRSYHTPQETWDVNVMGTVHLLEACRHTPSVKAVVVITTDKCYENKESAQGYTEEDRLGGYDPYSASKAAAELAVASYRHAFFNKAQKLLIATARAGNVVGGGDWAEDRLVPDLVRAQAKGAILNVRSPNAVRPWQHVLEPLSGYLLLGQVLFEGKKQYEGAWNFGPDNNEALSVSSLLARLQAYAPDLKWQVVADADLHETTVLNLDSTKARTQLSWHPVWSMEQQLEQTALWYKAFQESKEILSAQQLQSYLDTAQKAGAVWI